MAKSARSLELEAAHDALRQSLDVPERERLDAISLAVSDSDEMFVPGQAAHYLRVGMSAMHCIEEALLASGTDRRPRYILDLPCGHGRVLRHLRAAFPDADITCADTNRDGMAFCEQAFGAVPSPSEANLARVRLPRRYDLIWCGSLLTHLPERKAIDLFELFSEHLSPNGLCVFSTHGDGAIERLRNGVYSYGFGDQQRAEFLQKIAAGGYAFSALEQDYGIAFASSQTIRMLANRVTGWRESYFRTRGWDDHQDVFAFRYDGDPSLPARVRRTAKRVGWRLFGTR